MQHMVAIILGWTLAAVAAVGFVAGPASAAKVAGNALSTIGITVGSVAGGVDSLFVGFRAAQRASNDTTLGDRPNPQVRQKPQRQPQRPRLDPVGGGRNPQ